MEDLKTGAYPSIPTLEGKLICPVLSCGHDNVHFAGSVDETADEKPLNGIRLGFYCENGHSWIYRIEYHKGTTTLEIEGVNRMQL